jgi:hypothetical protein
MMKDEGGKVKVKSKKTSKTAMLWKSLFLFSNYANPKGLFYLQEIAFKREGLH